MNTITLMEASLRWTSDPVIMKAIADCFTYLTWVAVIVAAYLILEAVNRNDDDPDGFA